MSVEGYGSGIFQYGDTFHLFYCKTVDRPFNTVNKNQDIPFASRLDAADVKRSTTSFFTLETCVLVGIQAKKLAV